MAYNDDAVLARLSSLNESHDSIATAAQWLMFHRRHADRTVQLWLQRLKDSSSSKRLSLVYLANEVAQQSRIRHKEDFITAFSQVIAEAATVAYKGAPTDTQNKLRRVIEVWKDRSIFTTSVQQAIESSLDTVDKARGKTPSAFAGNIFGKSPSVPSQLTPLVSAYQRVTATGSTMETSVASANQDYEKQMESTAEVPSAPVFAARLNGLLKTLASAENAVAERVKARESLVAGLEELLQASQQELEAERTIRATMANRKAATEEKKQQVELAIMRAFDPANGQTSSEDAGAQSPSQEPDRPEIEALTPPAMEAFTPPDTNGSEMISHHEPAGLGQSSQYDEDRPALDVDRAEDPSRSPNATSQSSNKRRRVDYEGPSDGDDVDQASTGPAEAVSGDILGGQMVTDM